jgi:hypothetical protein
MVIRKVVIIISKGPAIRVLAARILFVEEIVNKVTIVSMVDHKVLGRAAIIARVAIKLEVGETIEVGYHLENLLNLSAEFALIK